LQFSGGGSEHTINGHRYAAELHMVHFNQKYGSMEVAQQQLDGLAVVAVLFELALEETNDGTNNNRFWQYLSNIVNAESDYKQTAGLFTIHELIKNPIMKYFSYRGSLTTPPCSESVTWIVSKQTVKIYPSELAAFGKLLNDDGKLISFNFRPLQKLNSRIVLDFSY